MPTVTSVATTADNQNSVSLTDNITVTFPEAMDTTYVTTSTSDTNCAGTIRLSSDNFSTCVKMSSSSPASFNFPQGITTDGTNLYVTEYCNHRIRKIVISTGVVTTVAGTGSSGSANDTGTSASFNLPMGITTDGTNLYVADYRNHLIRKIE